MAPTLLGCCLPKPNGRPRDSRILRRALYDEACTLRRKIALANPLLDFKSIRFTTHHGQAFGSLMVLRGHWEFGLAAGMMPKTRAEEGKDCAEDSPRAILIESRS